MNISPRRQREIVDALRRGTVPSNGLDALAVGLVGFETALNTELDDVSQGSAMFKVVRGEYGDAKTFFACWLIERAKRRGLVTADVKLSEIETPLHQYSTIFRRVLEHLTTA